MVPERRVVRYAPITYDALGAAVAPTGAEIQRFYTANKAVYGPSETRRLSQIILPDEAAAADVAERARKGENFAKIGEIGRASGRERGGQDVKTRVVARNIAKKQ